MSHARGKSPIGDALHDANGDQASGLSIFAGKAKPKSVEEGLNTALRELAQRAGIKKRVTIHTLRATCATLHHDADVPIVRIQRLLGHRNISTTSMYLRTAEEGLLNAHLVPSAPVLT